MHKMDRVSAVQRAEIRAAARIDSTRFFGRIAAVLAEQSPAKPRAGNWFWASGVVGAILLARSVDDPEPSDRILHACRTFYSDAFAGVSG
jgi:hypothetical protein